MTSTARTRPPTPTGRLLKVCGATSARDVDVLASSGADCVGLWHGVPGGRAELTADWLVSLAGAARRTGRLEPVLVTFLGDPRALADTARSAGMRWIQLHAYQSPPVVRSLRTALPEAVIVKVLHLDQGGSCPELPLIDSYARAGTDLFLLDTVADGGRIGSTGRSSAEWAVMDVVSRTTVPFLLAGGITPQSTADYPRVVRQPAFRGVDVDTAARDTDGRICAHAVDDLVRAWRNDPQEAHV
ncbi:phosphoribosylanthranilate isomerase [Nocardiopsis salina]|uniref:phosphoribosylanthranilate isomerase n=1 Tax=Nocardiopsis salina TaxID=245836 RepID=UPI00035C0C49|nr:hypothetical protein [Nocardiopsis salina]